MLLGITGTDGSGKGTVVNYLVERHGFVHYSARSIWIEKLTEQHLELSRANFRLMGNEMRTVHGNDFVVTHFLKKIAEDKPKHAIIDSLRAIDEAKTLKARGGLLISVDADPRIRYERVQGRRSDSDKVSYEEFLEHE